MTKEDISAGECYEAKVSNKIVIVRVDSLPANSRSSYICTNLKTGRTCYMKTAGRFRRVVSNEEVLELTNGNRT